MDLVLAIFIHLFLCSFSPPLHFLSMHEKLCQIGLVFVFVVDSEISSVGEFLEGALTNFILWDVVAEPDFYMKTSFILEWSISSGRHHIHKAFDLHCSLCKYVYWQWVVGECWRQRFEACKIAAWKLEQRGMSAHKQESNYLGSKFLILKIHVTHICIALVFFSSCQLVNI